MTTKNGGFTMSDIMMSTAAFSIMMVMFSPMFSISTRMSTAMDASIAMKDAGQKALNRISGDLNHCARLFTRNPLGAPNDDSNYFTNVLGQLGGLPSPLTGRQLPGFMNNDTQGLSLSNFNQDPSYVGNCLFLASLENSQDMIVRIVEDATPPVTRIRADTYRFDLYYLAAGAEEIGGKTVRNLYEWHSVSFADYVQIASGTDNMITTATISNLMAQGVQYAWDPTAPYINAFHQFSNVVYPAGSVGAGGTYSTMSVLPSAVPPIAMRSGGPVIKVPGVIHRYGVSPNTDDAFVTNDPVPKHHVPLSSWPDANTPDFPSGFEVKIQSYPGKHMVYARLVLVAAGNRGTTYSKEHLLLVSTRDLY